MQYAEEGVLHAAKREECHGGHNADVDANIAANHFVAELTGGFTIVGKDAMSISKFAVVTYLYGFAQGICPHDAHYRTKDFFVGYRHLRSYALKDARTQEAGVGMIAFYLEIGPAIQSELGSLFYTEFNIAHNVSFLFRIAHGAHLD